MFLVFMGVLEVVVDDDWLLEIQVFGNDCFGIVCEVLGVLNVYVFSIEEFVIEMCDVVMVGGCLFEVLVIVKVLVDVDFDVLCVDFEWIVVEIQVDIMFG